MVTLRFILTRLRLLWALLPLITFKKLFNLLKSIVFFLVKSERTVEHPPILILTLTNKCNYNCIICLKSSSKTSSLIDYPNPSEMDFDTLEKFLRQHADYLILVRLHGGEPLVYLDISRLVDLLNELKIPYNMVTNGSLLSKEICRKLVNNYCLGIGISLDAGTSATYEILRKGGNLDTISSNIKIINHLKKKFNSKHPVLSASMCTFSLNAHEMADLVKYCNQHHIPSLSIVEGWDYNTVDILEQHLVKNNIELTHQSIIEAKKEAKRLGITVRFRFPSLEDDKFKDIPYHKGNIKPKNCLNLYSSVWFLPNFDAIGCSSVTKSFGNINEICFDEFWNKKDVGYSQARQMFKKNQTPDACVNCIYTGGFFS